MQVILMLIFTLWSWASFATQVQKFTEIEEARWAQEYLSIYRNSKTFADLFRKVPTLSDFDRAILEKVVNPALPLPKLEIKNHDWIIDGKHRLQMISLNDFSFSIGGRRFQYQTKAGTVANLQKIDQFLSEKTALWNFWIAPAYADELNSDLVGPLESLSPIDLFSSAGSLVVSGPIAAKLLKGVIATTVFVPIHYVVTKAEANVKPSCENQIKDLQEILFRNHLGLAGVNCSSYSTENIETGADGKVVSFWTPSGKRKNINADWVNSIAWDDSNRLFIFDREKLTQYRELNSGFDSQNPKSKKILKFEKGSQKFEAAQSEIEPYRQVLKYIGENRSCYKCEEEMNRKLATEAPPRSAKKRRSTVKTQIAK